MSSAKYIASFVVNSSGEFIPAELSINIIEPSRVVAVIDEPAKKIHLWLGKKSSLNNRMGAIRNVKSIPTFGLKTKGATFPIGRDCRVIQIDESLTGSDSTTRADLAELEALLKKPHTEQSKGVWRVGELPSKEEGEMKTEAKVLEKRMQFEMSHLERETTGKGKKKESEEGKK
ncbi:MAG: hypothetical protein WED04_00370 [Promethearchaeati archaeon SRVP18_Atabeyarchaeia-1]